MVLNWTSRKEDIEALSCEYCMEVMKNPQRLPCGHSFCNPCLPMLKKKCIICAKEFKLDDVSKDILAFNLIEELCLKCDHGSCLWAGTFSDYQNHLKKIHLKSPPKERVQARAEELDKLRRVKSGESTPPKLLPAITPEEILKSGSAPVEIKFSTFFGD